MWLPTAMALLIQAYGFLATQGSLQFVHSLVATDVFYGLFLTLTWGAMWLATPAAVRGWAVAQETSGSRWRRAVGGISGRKVFSGGSGMTLILSFCLVGLFLAP